MKPFTKDGIEYSVKQDFGKTGIQYQAIYSFVQHTLTAWVFIPGKRHTREEIVQAFLELEEQLGDGKYE